MNIDITEHAVSQLFTALFKKYIAAPHHTEEDIKVFTEGEVNSVIYCDPDDYSPEEAGVTLLIACPVTEQTYSFVVKKSPYYAYSDQINLNMMLQENLRIFDFAWPDAFRVLGDPCPMLHIRNHFCADLVRLVHGTMTMLIDLRHPDHVTIYVYQPKFSVLLKAVTIRNEEIGVGELPAPITSILK